MPAPASYVAGLGCGASGFTTRSDIGPAREGPSAETIAEAQARRGEEPDVDPEQFQDPDNEYGLFSGTTYEQDIRLSRPEHGLAETGTQGGTRKCRVGAQHRSERPEIQQQFANLKRGLSVVTDQEWENIPELLCNLTRKKRRKDERSFVVPDSVIVGDRTKTEYDSSLDTRQQQSGGFETPADSGTMTNFVEIGQARDKILSLKLDQISGTSTNSGLATSVDPKGYLTSGVRRAICDMTLLIFHLVLSSYTFEGVDANLARRIVEWDLERYPNDASSVFFLFGAGRLALARSQPQRALGYYARAAQAQTQYRNMHHVSWWESAIANLALWNVDASKDWWSRLRREATWSKATYAYGEAACLATVGDHDGAAKLMDKVSALRQRIAGKSIPIEKFAARKARKYLGQQNRLILPALELAYVFTALAHAPRQVVLEDMIPHVRQALEELGVLEANIVNGVEKNRRKARSKAEGKEGYWDDLCLARFLEGVCWRFVAYPDPDAELDAHEKVFVSVEEAQHKAESTFEEVFENGPRIELDHYIVYLHYGRLLARSGDKEGAKAQFDMVLSGKPLEVNAAGRKGNYSLENALHIRTHGAVDALDQNRPL